MLKFPLAGLLLLNGAALAADPTLVVYNWAEYLPKKVLQQFTQETGIKVRYSTYDSNEAMYAKVKTVKGEGYDVLVPSTYTWTGCVGRGCCKGSTNPGSATSAISIRAC